MRKEGSMNAERDRAFLRYMFRVNKTRLHDQLSS